MVALHNSGSCLWVSGMLANETARATDGIAAQIGAIPRITDRDGGSAALAAGEP